MSRISIPAVEQSQAASRPLLDAVHKQLGVVPNLMKLVGHSPAALEGYLLLNGALAKGALSAPLRERIALAIAEYNGCDYCLSAHSYLAANLAKVSAAEIDAARDAHSSDAKTAAALKFARRVAAERGRVSDGDLASLRAAGFGEAEVVEIVLNVALNVLTNYINNVAQTDVDFPLVAHKAA
ncbi:MULTISPECIES: carboxymuconolactone decarboxylase family protein [unclassified Uliginosibacterium]|uniref:carboxymuconolactone decarboxylase family protein n=1 Tax=unclassified Uliginosibacterium TaxID=2621521 RepID=UPI000C7BA65B|nr:MULTISPECIES: carboxymuconolactone decarboxylase family protein [unclassified Uliginosibacterium]MDO6386307.1 carboxymuconolactone decarboxylase family protein [Uliginosibacterium sp. 31-12]PLK49375.1 alkylhydroperoxidase [Uliginosibacterium sp. TH139]